MHLSTDDYRDIFLSNRPLMDVRAPIEFDKGAFPGSINLPLMNDEERHTVGICYKQQGQDAAVRLGHRLVSGDVKQARIQAWVDFARTHPDGFLYCFRGGMRSNITQQWLHEAGIDYPLVTGGYKALRQFLIMELEQAAQACHFTQLGGLTGCGKTELLQGLEQAIDLEGHAHHRGSSFGRHATPQPSQINFENALAIDLLKHRAQGHSHLVVEDENRGIGSCHVPLVLHRRFADAPLVWLDEPFESRVERILKDYVIDLAAEFTALQGPEAGFAAFAEHLRNSLSRIVKRLGHERYQRLADMMDEALRIQGTRGDTGRHRDWITALLREYYDPMYDYQIQRHAQRIVFRGTRSEVCEYLNSHCNAAI